MIGGVYASLCNPAAGTYGLRKLGTGSTDAAAGNDSRLSDTRTPTAASITAAMFSAQPDALFPELFDYEALRRVSDLETMDRFFAQSAPALTTGQVIGVTAIARTSFTATQMRLALVAAATTAQHAHMAIWNASTRALLAATADDTTILTTSAPAIITRSLSSPASLAIVKGTKYIIGAAYAFTVGSPTMRGLGTSTVVAGTSPQFINLSTGYAGTVPDPIGTSAASSAFWLTVLP